MYTIKNALLKQPQPGWTSSAGDGHPHRPRATRSSTTGAWESGICFLHGVSVEITEDPATAQPLRRGGRPGKLQAVLSRGRHGVCSPAAAILVERATTKRRPPRQHLHGTELPAAFSWSTTRYVARGGWLTDWAFGRRRPGAQRHPRQRGKVSAGPFGGAARVLPLTSGRSSRSRRGRRRSPYQRPGQARGGDQGIGAITAVQGSFASLRSSSATAVVGCG